MWVPWDVGRGYVASTTTWYNWWTPPRCCGVASGGCANS